MRTWSLACGIFVWLASFTGGVGRWSGLLLGVLAGLAVFLGLRLYRASLRRL